MEQAYYFSKFDIGLTLEAKKFFNDLFRWKLTDEELKTKEMKLAAVMDSLSVFGVYSYVRPVLRNGRNEFTVLCFLADPGAEGEVYTVDLSGADKKYPETFFPVWEMAFIAATVPGFRIAARYLGASALEQNRLAKKGQKILQRMFGI